MNDQPNIIPGLPAKGWSYCPRCDKESMATVEPNKQYECPMCGLGFIVTYMGPGGNCALRATQPITMVEMMRYQSYCQSIIKAKQDENTIDKAPPRIQMAYKILSLVGAIFGVKIEYLSDTWTTKEGNSEQSKR